MQLLKLHISILASLFFFMSASAQADDVQEIKWMDYEDARASNSSKPIFVFAEMAFCSACKKMKEDVFVLDDIAATLNNDFIPVRMHTLGIFPNKLSDLRDENGDELTLEGSPGFVIIKDEQYSVFYGFQSADTLRKVFQMVLND
ncbi:thioredoxin family protein [Glaciecola sp. MH2013]|uniref:thioredoxin family protein n=1 Tax=Glaciecola sp. MH2013 TaxID=2785524 RepID=UPI0018A03A65|nr:thioredoxin family protein [Glaciecola sp. MH2013]MBF7073878.1 thioredoxin family protein [Glaciecola sp. MH2013]